MIEHKNNTLRNVGSGRQQKTPSPSSGPYIFYSAPIGLSGVRSVYPTPEFLSRCKGELLGGGECVRFSEFNFRETPENAGLGAMNFHHDAVREDRFERRPYYPCDWL